MSAVSITESQLTDLVQSLPASPRLLAELAPKLQQVEVPLAEVSAVLRRDPGLTARLISVANSAAYAREEPAASLEEAVACIGYRDVYQLVGAVAASQMAEQPLQHYGIEPHRFRENALFVALVMEELAVATDLEPRAAYTVGLLRSIGKVALERLPPGAPTTRSSGRLLEWEAAHWGCTSAAVGAQVLALWRFPEETVTAVREQYEPSQSSMALTHVLNLAAGAADLRGFGLPGEEEYWAFSPVSFEQTGIDEGKLVWAGERAFQTLKKLAAALA